MPTIPVLLSRAQAQEASKSRLTGTAIAFLVPLFVVFIFGPFFCIWLVKHRRAANAVPSITFKYTSPRQRREDVKKELEGVTKVVSNVTSGKAKSKDAGVGTVERKASIDGASIAERDWSVRNCF
ncbi:hypothetical protein K491DRAFT_696877 [Lophiostoma macrostomum CBS 122681]|uniref:Uncharacterized protein n=1 Tax=Lophiostoma macrostomum CBS 122681 TaxID=1314788 RepID=A0A6A6STG2_9PLEO|nr:hypothetical protein K491DRAFT_696877 [Lophiostoma macrostomum CBS 122681]